MNQRELRLGIVFMIAILLTVTSFAHSAGFDFRTSGVTTTTVLKMRATDAPPTCSLGYGWLYYDLSEQKWKICENGSAWVDLFTQIGGGSGVSSFNARVGAVTPQQSDYDAFFTTPAEAASGAPVQSVAGRAGTVTLSVGDVSGAAPLASPAFTGTPTAPTPATASNSTLISTTAWVRAQNYVTSASPALTGTPTAPTATAGTSTAQLATTAFATAADNLKAPLASPTLTGDPKAPTPLATDNDTSIATSAFVKAQNYITSAGAPVQSIFGRSGAVTASQADYDSFFLTPTEGNAAYGQLGSSNSWLGYQNLTAGAQIKGDSNASSSGTLSVKLGLLSSTPSSASDAYVAVNNAGGPGATSGDLLFIPRSTANAGIRMFTGAPTPTERLSIDSSGVVSMPAQPFARVTLSTTQSIPDSTMAAVSFDTETRDVGSMHDNVTNPTRITIVSDGTYSISGSIRWPLNATGYRYLQITKNGANVAVDSRNAVSGNVTVQAISTTVYLVAGQYIEMSGYQTSGTSLAVVAGDGSTWLAVAKLN